MSFVNHNHNIGHRALKQALQSPNATVKVKVDTQTTRRPQGTPDAAYPILLEVWENGVLHTGSFFARFDFGDNGLLELTTPHHSL